MANPLTATANTDARPRHWTLFLAGVLLFLIGPAIYAYQLIRHNLSVPWYVPALATAGVLLMAFSLWQRRGVARGIGLVLFLLVCGFEWFFLLVATRSPEYTGPAQPGHAIPAFTTRLADGSEFTDKDLQNGKTVLVFFRGRW